MRYENQVCPGCGQTFNENDDIVVCPDCGTPQHRECWQKQSRCVNSQLHSKGFSWVPPERQGSGAPEQQEYPPQEQQGSVAVCPSCGAANSLQALHCEHCGNPLTRQEGTPPPFEAQLPPEFSDYENDIGDLKVADAAFYVRTSLRKYLPLFARFAKGEKKFSWNWAALFLSPYWFFYRRLNKLGVIFVAILATLALAMSIPFADYVRVYENVYDEIFSEETSEERMDEINGELIEAMEPISPFIAGYVLIHVVCALIADKAYYKKMRSDFGLIKQSGAKGDEAKMFIARRGGVSLLGFMAGFFGYEAFCRILIMLSDKLSQYI